VDDGARTGGLQALLLIVGGVGVFLLLTAGAWVPGVVGVLSLVMVGWLERYARRRARHEREIRERAKISHLDF